MAKVSLEVPRGVINLGPMPTTAQILQGIIDRWDREDAAITYTNEWPDLLADYRK